MQAERARSLISNFESHISKPRSHARVRVHAIDQIVHLCIVLPPIALIGLRHKHYHYHKKEKQTKQQDGQQRPLIDQLRG